MSEAGFESLGEGRYRVTGNLGFDTVPGLWAQSIAELNDSAEPVIELGHVAHVDSAGLALVIEWIRWARSHGRHLSFVDVPEKLLALARISEIDGFLGGASGKADGSP